MVKMIKANTQRLLFWSALIFLFVGFALYLGVLPGVSLPSLRVSVWAGQVQDLANNASLLDFSFDSYCYPAGAEANEGFLVFILARFFMLFGADSLLSLSLSFFVLYTIGFIALVFFLRFVSKNALVTLLAIVIYYLLPFLTASDEVVPIFFGLLILPVSLLTDFLILECLKKSKPLKWNSVRTYLFLFAIFASKLALLSTGWYIGFMGCLVSGLFFLLVILFDVRKKSLGRMPTKLWKYLIYVLLPWGIAVGLTYLVTADGTSSISYGLERLNGSSLDVASMVLPSSDQFISNIVSLDRVVPSGYMLTGDSAFWSNYVSFAMLAGIIIMLVKEKGRNKYNVALLIVIVSCFVLAIGPSFKFLALVPSEDRPMYNLPFSSGTLFPWYPIFSMFPFSLMRTTYRWVFFVILLVFILFVRFMRASFAQGKKQRILALVLCALCIISFLPNRSPIDIVYEKRHNYVMAVQQRNDIVAEIKDFVKEGSLIAICNYGGSDNAYLTATIATALGVQTYSGSGDKAVALSRNQIPKKISYVQNTQDADDIVINLRVAIEQGLECDYLLLPYFDLRYDTDFWPPNLDSEAALKKKEIASIVAWHLKDLFPVFEGEFYTVIDTSGKSGK